MKILITKTLVALLALGSVMSCQQSDAADMITLTSSVEDDNVRIMIVNNSSREQVFRDPWLIAITPDDAGVFLAMSDEAGQPREMCAMLNDGINAPDFDITVAAGKSVSTVIRKRIISQLFCLSSGKYNLEVSIRGGSGRVRAKPIHFDLKLDETLGR